MFSILPMAHETLKVIIYKFYNYIYYPPTHTLHTSYLFITIIKYNSVDLDQVYVVIVCSSNILFIHVQVTIWQIPLAIGLNLSYYRIKISFHHAWPMLASEISDTLQQTLLSLVSVTCAPLSNSGETCPWLVNSKSVDIIHSYTHTQDDGWDLGGYIQDKTYGDSITYAIFMQISSSLLLGKSFEKL